MKTKNRRVIDRHHLIPKSRGGGHQDWNLLRIEYEKHHECWHKLFGNRTIFEVIVLLKRLIRMKNIPHLPKKVKYGHG
jgi:hypothetical protein